MRWTKCVNAETGGLPSVPVVVVYDTELRRMALVAPTFAYCFVGVEPRLYRTINEGAAFEAGFDKLKGYHLCISTSRQEIVEWTGDFQAIFAAKELERWKAQDPRWQAHVAQQQAEYEAKKKDEEEALRLARAQRAAEPPVEILPPAKPQTPEEKQAAARDTIRRRAGKKAEE